MSFMARHELATACARRIWNIGFEPSRLANVVGAAPPRLLAALRRLLGAAQRAGGGAGAAAPYGWRACGDCVEWPGFALRLAVEGVWRGGVGDGGGARHRPCAV